MLLEHWTFQATAHGETSVLPDGCCDLIVKQAAGAAPVWFMTDLAQTSTPVHSRCGDRYNGFRLRPGVQIDRAGLLASMEGGLSDAAIKDRLQCHVRQNPAVSEALACLAGNKAGVAKAAADLGVQTRSLQRLLKRSTGQTPVFWMRLARVRQLAASLAQSGLRPVSLAELAYDMGYADQAHMSRETRHWLGLTPRQIRCRAGWGAEHLGLGYGV